MHWIYHEHCKDNNQHMAKMRPITDLEQDVPLKLMRRAGGGQGGCQEAYNTKNKQKILANTLHRSGQQGRLTRWKEKKIQA